MTKIGKAPKSYHAPAPARAAAGWKGAPLHPARGRSSVLSRIRGVPARVIRSLRGRLPRWTPIAVYVLVVLVAGAAIVAWDRAYEARRAGLFRPASPQVQVKNTVEEIIGPGSVTDVKIDSKANTLDLTVRDVLFKPGQPVAEQKKNLTSEGTLAIQFVQARMRFASMTVRLIRDGKTLATVRAASGQTQPATEFAPELK